MEAYYNSSGGCCRGCRKSGLTLTGLTRHIKQSQNPLCELAFLNFGPSEDSEMASLSPQAPPSDSSGQSPRSQSPDNAPSRPQSPMLADTIEMLEVPDDPFEGGVGEEDEEGELDQDGEEEEEEDGTFVDLEHDWEPEPAAEDPTPYDEVDQIPRTQASSDASTDPYFGDSVAPEARREAESRAGRRPAVVQRYSDKYPEEQAGQPVFRTSSSHQPSNTASNPYAPFASKMDWEVAKWAKLRGPGSTAFSDLLAVDGVLEALNLSYSNSNQLNSLIDDNLPTRPQFVRREIIAGGEAFEFYARDPIDCIKALWGDPEFIDELVFEPERHYLDENRTIRVFHDMYTAKWWWSIQRKLKEMGKVGATVIPVIIASDKTQLTTFHGKVAYPVYLTIGNLPKHVRRKPSRQGQVLLGYLPATKLQHITNKAARRRMLANLFHACMGYILKPLRAAGHDGVELTSADGVVRRCHPILATFVGDYPEQLLVTCIKTGSCPTCPAKKDGCGDPSSVEEPRDPAPILRALDTIRDGGAAFTKACTEAHIRPIQEPFWKHLPLVNIYATIAPDILHQLHQGVIKHLIAWLRRVYGDNEIDARCRRFPPNHNIRLFMKGLSPLSRVTGTEHDQIARIILGLIIDIRLPNNLSAARLLRSVRALLDFLYLAQYPVHTAETLCLLDEALDTFHANKDILIQLGVREHFDFPKLHSLGHYHFYIEMFGTTDNYNTAYTERLHIDLAKDAYRATNCKDEYAQMTAWLDRRERILQHEQLVRRRLNGWKATVPQGTPLPPRPLPLLVYPRTQKMAVHPSVRGVSLHRLHEEYGAVNFEAALARYVIHCNYPYMTRRQMEDKIQNFYVPNKWSVYHRIKFTQRDPFAHDSSKDQIVDSIHVQPTRRDKRGQPIPARFDTALIRLEADPDNGPNPRQTSTVGRVRCVFTIPSAFSQRWFTDATRPRGIHFAYIDWYNDFPSRPEPHHGLYKISPLRQNGEQQSSIVAVEDIWQSVHLFPSFGSIANREWTSSSVLDDSQTFFVNTFSSRYMYSTLY